MSGRRRQRAFDDPIPIPGGRQLITLPDQRWMIACKSNDYPPVSFSISMI
jgi:hypothetical protein